MNRKETEALKEINYANLNSDQERKLRDFESRFNSEFGEDYNILVMKKEKEQ